MKSFLLICGVLVCLLGGLVGCQGAQMVASNGMTLRDGQCCYDRPVVRRSFSVKGPQWRQPRFTTEQICYPCDVQPVCPADAGAVCNPCK